MGATSSPDPLTGPFESGTLWLALQPTSLSTGSTPCLGLMTPLPMCVTHLYVLPSHLPLITKRMPVFLQSRIWKDGLGTHRVAYYTGYPTTVVKASIHLPF